MKPNKNNSTHFSFFNQKSSNTQPTKLNIANIPAALVRAIYDRQYRIQLLDDLEFCASLPVIQLYYLKAFTEKKQIKNLGKIGFLGADFTLALVTNPHTRENLCKTEEGQVIFVKLAQLYPKAAAELFSDSSFVEQLNDEELLVLTESCDLFAINPEVRERVNQIKSDILLNQIPKDSTEYAETLEAIQYSLELVETAKNIKALQQQEKIATYYQEQLALAKTKSVFNFDDFYDLLEENEDDFCDEINDEPEEDEKSPNTFAL